MSGFDLDRARDVCARHQDTDTALAVHGAVVGPLARELDAALDEIARLRADGPDTGHAEYVRSLVETLGLGMLGGHDLPLSALGVPGSEVAIVTTPRQIAVWLARTAHTPEAGRCRCGWTPPKGCDDWCVAVKGHADAVTEELVRLAEKVCRG